MCAGCFYVEVELNRDIDKIRDTTASIELTIDTVNGLVSLSTTTISQHILSYSAGK